MDRFFNFAGKINRRGSTNKVDQNSPRKRINLVSRDGLLSSVVGVEDYVSGFNGTVNWATRYHTTELGINEPKTFVYSQDGVLSVIDDNNRTRTELRNDLNKNAYPKSWNFKLDTITYTYMVDGRTLWKTNGNNDNEWEDVGLVDNEGNPYDLIDCMEHLERMLVLSENFLFVSANLEPDNFTDPTDSIQLIVGTGKGRNIGMGRVEDTVYIFNTEGIFALVGDVLSAVAETFEIRLVDEKICVAGRTIQTVEKAIVFLADDLELYSWNGNTSTLLSYEENLAQDINPDRVYLDRAVSTYDHVEKIYKLSVVKTGLTYNTLEYWYDALENKIDMVEGRNVSCYVHTDPTVENRVTWVGKSDKEIFQRETGRNFDGKAPNIHLLTADLPIGRKGENARISNIYPQYQCTGERDMFFRYLLDGRISDIPTGGTDNAVLNPVFNDWSSGASALPDNWSNAFSSGCTQSTDSYSGDFSANVASVSPILGTYIGQTFSDITYRGYKLKFSCYVKCSTANKARIQIGTPFGTSYVPIQASSFHSGSGEWERLECETTFPTANTAVLFVLGVGALSSALFDGAIVKIEPMEVANFTQDLSGEAKALGFIRIANQRQTTDRVKPRIKYSKGETIAFEIVDQTLNMELELLGIGYDVIQKGRIKGKGVGA